ncbi:MAG TPA: ATP-binding protein [Thermomicrobiales bacterium]|nr:ATP-binding protein [Thermomicrobiales bacterium]
MVRAHGTARELRQVALELTGSLDLADVSARALAAVRALAGADAAMIALLDERGDALECFSDPPGHEQSRRHEAPTGASRQALARRADRCIPDLAADPAADPDLLARGWRAAAILPLVVGGETVGLLYAGYHEPHTFTRRERAVLRGLAAPAAVALRNARRYAAATGTAADLHAALAGLEQGVVTTDQAGRIRYANERFGDLFGGLDVAGLSGRPHREVAERLLAPRLRDSAAYLARLAWLDAHPDEAATDTLALLRPPGRILERYSGPLRDATGALPGRVAVFTDVTEARRVQRAKEEFLSVASHELKTPITTLGGYLEMIQRQVAREGGPDPARLARYIGNAQTQLARLRRLSDDLLEVARIEAGRLTVRPEPRDLATIAEETVARFARHPRPEQAGRGSQLIYHAAESLPGYFDAPRLEQVFANLLENAAKYSPAGGEITVAARREGDTAVVSVRDRGIGIPAAERDRLFTPFYRATNAEASSAQGLGLGLYISRGIVEAHGGRIWVEPAPGGGSVFNVALPLDETIDDRR